jgi:acetylornithine deacetylase/succinyl-diaminopimelate desuccinylase-like protein
MTDGAVIDRYIDHHLEQNLVELSQYVGQPSIAAQRLGMEDCAAMVAAMMRTRGFAVDTIASDGAPVVVAERAGRTDRTLLIYNHYDVQPPEPLELWTNPPFELTRRDGALYGRGVSDDKGHLTSRLLALDALLAARGELPCRVKWVVEGEEEIGSLHLPAFLVLHRERLAADACLWEFGVVDDRGVPQLHAGLRGICYVELSVETATLDAHSGLTGSILPNAAWRLVWALASLKAPDERIRIPGYNDAVRSPTARDRELMAQLPDTADQHRAVYGVKEFLKGLDGGLEMNLAQAFEPTCTICGITTGYQGAGAKTVLPAHASAKVDFRLVPDQTPADVFRSLRAHLDNQGFGDVKATLVAGGAPSRTDPDHPFLAMAAHTAEPVYGVPMQIVPMIGGSGPAYAFIETLGVPIATAGLGHAGGRIHAPDENLRIDDYVKHAKHVARLLDAFAVS